MQNETPLPWNTPFLRKLTSPNPDSSARLLLHLVTPFPGHGTGSLYSSPHTLTAEVTTTSQSQTCSPCLLGLTHAFPGKPYRRLFHRPSALFASGRTLFSSVAMRGTVWGVPLLMRTLSNKLSLQGRSSPDSLAWSWLNINKILGTF